MTLEVLNGTATRTDSPDLETLPDARETRPVVAVVNSRTGTGWLMLANKPLPALCTDADLLTTGHRAMFLPANELGSDDHGYRVYDVSDMHKHLPLRGFDSAILQRWAKPLGAFKRHGKPV